LLGDRLFLTYIIARFSFFPKNSKEKFARDEEQRALTHVRPVRLLCPNINGKFRAIILQIYIKI
jgi:hypothetical protein